VAKTLEIPPFRLDLAEERLWRGSELVSLRPRNWSVLRYLVERPGRLVRHEEILDAVWADAAVTPNTLNTSIRELRKALGDDARAPRYIETVHRRGFRFVGEFGHANETASEASPRLSGPAPPLVTRGSLHGRSDALAELEARLAEARAGRRQIAFVTGEVGIGKTSLLRTFVQQQAAQQTGGDLRIAWGQSVRQHGECEAYRPVLDALDRLLRSEDRESLRVALRQFAPTWLLQLPWLLEPSESEDLRRELAGVSAARMLREFCVATEALASDPVLVLVLEDLHWSDAATVDLIGALAERSDPARLLLLGSYRPVDAAVREHPIAPLRRALQQRGAASELSLDPLPGTAVESYLCERFGWQEAPAGLAFLIEDHADGNALFMVTLTNYLVSKQLLRCSGGAWSLAVPPESLVAAAPESLREIVEEQLDMLTFEERDLLDVASVAGESFAVQSLAAGLGVEAESLEVTCSRLSQRGQFIEEQWETHWPDGTLGCRFGFQHSTFRHVTYSKIPSARRRQLHLKIAERMEVGHASAPEGPSAEIAAHFEEAGDRLRAVTHLAKAATSAQQRFAHREATATLRWAVGLLEETPGSRDRDRREFELRSELTRTIATLGYQDPEVGENLDRCLALSRRLGDTRAEAFTLARLARRDRFLSDYGAARATLDRLRQIAPSLGSPAIQADVDFNLAHLYLIAGELDRAEEAFEAARTTEVDIAEALEHAMIHPQALALAVGAVCTWLRGFPADARQQAEDALRELEEGGHRPSTAAGYLARGEVGRLTGRADKVREALEGFASEAERSKLVFRIPTLCALQGWLLLEEGRTEVAVDHLCEGLAELRSPGTNFWTSSIHAVLAEALLAKGDVQSGLRASEEALEYCAKIEERVWEADLRRLRGELLLLQGRTEAAEASFHQALEVSRAQGARSLELRAATSLARSWYRRGDTGQAREVLEPILGGFDQGRDTRDLLAARALLQAS